MRPDWTRAPVDPGQSGHLAPSISIGRRFGEETMTIDNMIIALIITVFAIFGAVLFAVSVYVRVGDKPAAGAVAANRNEAQGRARDRAAA